MANGRDGTIAQHLRMIYESGAIGRLTDGQLLERFATGRGEAAERAFALLVERHGPRVLRVCRGVLDDPNDAQDAFQATFLVLLRKSRGLWVRDSLGPWLHQVALRTASCARSVAARRRRHERRAAELAASEAAQGETAKSRDWEWILHQEIDRLPERYRVAVVLCDLEGQTHSQVARNLGWPVGTVKSRLARARERLRARLIRRGLAPAVGLAAFFTTASIRAAVPAALVRSTIALATTLTAAGTVPATVAALAKGALKTMLLAKFRALAFTLLAITAATGAGMVAWGDGPASPKSPENPAAAQSPKSSTARAVDVPVFEATTGKLTFDVVERGRLEATRDPSLVNEVEGRTTILSILPEGTRVKKGDLVCELDSAPLKDRVVGQEEAVLRARADYLDAQLAHSVAEASRNEYTKGIYVQDEFAFEGKIAAAQSAIEEAEDRAQRARRAREQIEDIRADRRLDPADILAELEILDRLDTAERAILLGKKSLEQAKVKRKTYRDFTHKRRVRELERAEIHTKFDESFKKQAFELEESKLKKLLSQIDKTKLYAPNEGMIVYANDPSHPGDSNRPSIEEGAVVRERQPILSVVNIRAPMQVNAWVRETWVDQIQYKQPVHIRVDAFPTTVFSGVVTEVAPVPSSTIFARQNKKVYPTRIRFEEGNRALRPGMSAEVQIHVAERDNVVRVPIRAIVGYHRKDQTAQVAVKTREGGFEWRVVNLGLANEEMIEVREGLREGDLVAADPTSLMSEEQRRARSGELEKPAEPPK